MPPEVSSSDTGNQKQNWFFVRGLVREAAHWGDFPSQFEKAFPNANVFCLDLPGNGRFWRMKTPTSMKAIVDFLRLEFHRIRERQARESGGTGEVASNYVLAISLGGMVTLDWMSRYPKDLTAAVLINTSLRGFSPFYKRMSPYALASLLKIATKSDIGLREKQILKLTSQRSWPELAIAGRVEVQRERPVRRGNALRQLIAALIHSPLKARPPAPVLLLNSLGDRLVHPDCSEAIRKQWQVPMKRHAWAGHDLPLDDSAWTLEAIDTWLREIAPLNPALAKKLGSGNP